MKPEEFKSLVKTLSNVIDQRAKTTEMVIKAELRAEVNSLEERLSSEILAARAEAHADNMTLNANFVREIQRLKKRAANIEKHTGITDPTIN